MKRVLFLALAVSLLVVASSSATEVICSLSKNSKEIPNAFSDESPQEGEPERHLPGISPLAFDNYDVEEPIGIHRARVDYAVIFEARSNPWQDWIFLTAYVDASAQDVQLTEKDVEGKTALSLTVGETSYEASCYFEKDDEEDSDEG